MIFTVGNARAYALYREEAERSGVPFQKKGRDQFYDGGSVWQFRAEAQAFADRVNPQRKPEDVYAVFGVDADWEADTAVAAEHVPMLQWRALLRDADLIIL